MRQKKRFKNTKYFICETGRVFNEAGHEISQWNSYGRGGVYKRVTLYHNGTKRNYRVHRLVAMVYLNNTLNKPEVHHIDANTFNNNVSNLEWVTGKENCQKKLKFSA